MTLSPVALIYKNESGNMDTDVSEDIVASLEAATDRCPRGSAAEANVLRNSEYYPAVQHKLKASYYNNWWQWLPSWGPPPFAARPDANAVEIWPPRHLSHLVF